MLRKFVLFLFALSGTALAADDLEKRVEALEIASYTNTLIFSGFFETRYEQGTIKPKTGDKDVTTINTMIGGLDFKSIQTDRVSVFGRLVFTSQYNPARTSANEANFNWNEGRGYVDSHTYFERFFANIKVIDNLYFTFGRLPTIDGPPYHFQDGLPRQGSYPKWIYPAILDGYALTYTVPFSDKHTLALRAIHSPISNLIPNFGYEQTSKFQSYKASGKDATGAAIDKTYVDKIDETSVMVDYNNSTTPFTRDLNVIAQLVKFQDYDFAPTIRAAYQNVTLYVEANQVANSGLSLYLTHSATKVSSDGYFPYATASGAIVPISTMKSSPDGSAKGKGSALGLNYRLPIAALSDPAIGLEYIKNDKNFMLFELTPRQLFDLYGVRGKATHVYWSQPLYSGANLRLGTMMINPDFTPGIFGEPAKTETKLSSLYANIRLDF